MSAVVERTAVPVFLGWLADPSEVAGVHVRTGDGRWDSSSYRELCDAAHGLARRLAGDAVGAMAVCSERADEVLVAAGASWLLGVPIHVVPAPYTFGSPDEHLALVARNLSLATTRHLVVGRHAGALAERIAGALAPTSPAALHAVDEIAPGAPLPVRAPPGAAVHQFTSGSTGSPKLVRVSSANLAAQLEFGSRALCWRDGDALASWLPLNHDMGLVSGLLLAASRQSDLWVCSPQQFLRDPWAWLEPLADGRATVTTGPTFGYGYAAARLGSGRETGADFGTWRCATIGAELVSPRVLAAFARRFAPCGFSARAFAPGYGMAECTLAATAVRPGEGVRAAPVLDPAGWSIGAPAPLGEPAPLDFADVEVAQRDALVSCGRAVGGFDVSIVDEDGSPLPEGCFGEIRLRGASVAQVASEPVRGRAPVVPTPSLRTGDGGVLIGGELYVVGRLGDGVKVRGAFVDCESLEQRLLRALGLRAGDGVLALGQLGGEPHAVLVVRRGSDCDGALPAALKVLRAAAGPGATLAIVAAGRRGMPRTSSGKPQRRRIWAQWIEDRAAAALAPAGATSGALRP